MKYTYVNSFSTLVSHPKKNIFRLKYYCCAHDLEKFQSALDPTEKKLFPATILVTILFFYSYSTDMVYETWKLMFGIMLMSNENHVDLM